MLRIFTVSILAPLVACCVVSLVTYGSLDRFSFLPLILAVPASLLLLAPVYAAAKERGMAEFAAYALLAVVGGACGALMLGAVSSGRVGYFSLGGAYGLATAACWSVLNLLAKRLAVRLAFGTSSMSAIGR